MWTRLGVEGEWVRGVSALREVSLVEQRGSQPLGTTDSPTPEGLRVRGTGSTWSLGSLRRPRTSLFGRKNSVGLSRWIGVGWGQSRRSSRGRDSQGQYYLTPKKGI